MDEKTWLAISVLILPKGLSRVEVRALYLSSFTPNTLIMARGTVIVVTITIGANRRGTIMEAVKEN